jgi:hypothetical protein
MRSPTAKRNIEEKSSVAVPFGKGTPPVLLEFGKNCREFGLFPKEAW